MLTNGSLIQTNRSRSGIYANLVINGCAFSVCHTTRAARKDEDNLEDYCFVSQEEFEQGVVLVRMRTSH